MLRQHLAFEATGSFSASSEPLPDHRGQGGRKSQFGRSERWMLQPVAPSSVMSRRAGLIRRDEVVEHDRPPDPQPSLGGVQRWFVSRFFAFASAVEHQQIEWTVFPQRLPVVAQHSDVGMIGKQVSRGSRTDGVAFDAHEGSRRVSCPNHPCQPDSAPRPGLTDAQSGGALGEDRQQPALLRRTGVIEPMAGRHSHRGTHQGWQIDEVRVCRIPSDCHAPQVLPRT